MSSLEELRAVLRQDLARNDHWLSPVTLFTYRLGQRRDDLPPWLRLPAMVAYRLLDRVFLQVLLGVELPAAVTSGPGLRLPHGGRGLVVHPAVTLGSDVTIYHRVTIGVRGTRAEAPTIGNEVYIGAGACILGPVTVGDGARIGANAVVLADVPAGATAVGVPARIVERS